MLITGTTGRLTTYNLNPLRNRAEWVLIGAAARSLRAPKFPMWIRQHQACPPCHVSASAMPPASPRWASPVDHLVQNPGRSAAAIQYSSNHQPPATASQQPAAVGLLRDAPVRLSISGHTVSIISNSCSKGPPDQQDCLWLFCARPLFPVSVSPTCNVHVQGPQLRGGWWKS